MEAGELAGVAGALLVSAVVQLTAGFGFSLVGMPLMVLFTDTRTASMIAGTLSLVTSGFQAWHGRAEIKWHSAGRLCAASAIGMPFGLLVFEVASERGLRLLLGVATLGMVVLLWRGFDLSGRGHGADWVAGTAAGMLTTSLSTNGPPLVLVLQARQLSPGAFRATITTVFTLTGAAGLVARGALGGYTGPVLAGLAASPVPVAAGMLAGFRLRRHVDGERFRAVVLVLLVAAGVSAILAARST